MFRRKTRIFRGNHRREFLFTLCYFYKKLIEFFVKFQKYHRQINFNKKI